MPTATSPARPTRDGHTTTYAYDADNRQISVTDPLGETTHRL